MLKQQHRLAAIMFTDIVGYTALMGSDEEKAFQLLEKNRKIHLPIIEKRNGTFLKEIGDSILASFQSVYDAVKCAQEIIESTQGEQDLSLKIGIHEGDVVFKKNDVYGDGVNIASRLEQEASANMICISGKVYQEIKNKADIHAQFVEEKSLKNVDHPVKIYQIRSDQAFSQSSLDENQTNKKSIIVLPFVNMSPDPNQEYFSDGLTEEIITDLSHIHDLLVISRNSAMTFKGTKKKTKEIASEVNVRYVLEGSVRKAGNDLRITAQLIDGNTDVHLWAEKYSGTLDDIFDIQEKVSRSIVNTLELKLNPIENNKILERPINNAQAYELHLRAHYEMHLFSKESLERAIQFIKSGLKIIGENEILYADLGLIYIYNYEFVSKKDKEYLKNAEVCIEKVFLLNPKSSYGHALKGNLYLRNGEIRKGAAELKHSLDLNPMEQTSRLRLGIIYTLAGKPNAARSLFGRLLEMDPVVPINHLVFGILETFEGNFHIGLKFFLKAREIEPKQIMFMWWNAVCLAYQGLKNEAIGLLNRIEKDSSMPVFYKLAPFFKDAILKKPNEALQSVTEELKSLVKEDDYYPIWMAECYALINRKEEALDWLEQGIEFGCIHYPWLSKTDPFLENIRGEPRFKELMKRVKYEWENFEF